MRMEPCYRCGKIKLASFNIYTDPGFKTEDIEMLMMSYGKHRNQYRCKDCKQPSEFFSCGRREMDPGVCPDCLDHFSECCKKVREFPGQEATQ